MSEYGGGDVSADVAIDGDDVDAVDITVNDSDEVLVLDEVANPNLHFEMWEPTGVAEVDAALDDLAGMSELPVNDHAKVFASIHDSLREQLARADGERPA